MMMRIVNYLKQTKFLNLIYKEMKNPEKNK